MIILSIKGFLMVYKEVNVIDVRQKIGAQEEVRLIVDFMHDFSPLNTKDVEIERNETMINYLKLGNLVLIIAIIIIIYSHFRVRKKRVTGNNEYLKDPEDQEINIQDKDHYIINIQNQLKLYEKLKGNLVNDIETLKYQGRISNYAFNKLNKRIHESSLLLERIIKANQKNDLKEHYFRSLLLSRYPDLTTSDIEICTFIKLGLTNKEIARLRGTSVNSIKAYKYRIRKKMQLKSRENIDKHLKSI